MSLHRSKMQLAIHSINSSARASTVTGIVSPSAFAVVRLMTSSSLFGCSTGMSAGFAPRKILSTNSAARRVDPGNSFRRRPDRPLQHIPAENPLLADALRAQRC